MTLIGISFIALGFGILIRTFIIEQEETPVIIEEPIITEQLSLPL